MDDEWWLNKGLYQRLCLRGGSWTSGKMLLVECLLKRSAWLLYFCFWNVKSCL